MYTLSFEIHVHFTIMIMGPQVAWRFQYIWLLIIEQYLQQNIVNIWIVNGVFK